MTTPPHRIHTSDLLISFTRDADGKPVCGDVVRLDLDSWDEPASGDDTNDTPATE